MRRFLCLIALPLVVAACSTSDSGNDAVDNPGPTGVGGTSAAGGSTGGHTASAGGSGGHNAGGSGGATAAGGAHPAGGGGSGQGGNGGAPAAGHGGAATGGSSTGGTSAGGASTGGQSAGGTGGDPNGAGGAVGGQAGMSQSMGGDPTGGGGTSGLSGSGGTSSGPVTAADLLALTSTCKSVASKSRYKTDADSASATVDVCQLTGAVFWVADMDIDCDGKETASCSLSTDPDFQAQTSLSDSNGDYLDSANLPYVVVPLPSSDSSMRWDYMAAGVKPGALVAVIYNGKLTYGVFGDEGPEDIIGESSVAMANSLGIPSDPSNGGSDGPVTYIVFTGDGAVVSPIEDHGAATTLGDQKAAELLQNN